MKNLVLIGVLLVCASHLLNAEKKKCKDRLKGGRCSMLKRYCISHAIRMQSYCPETCDFCNGVCLDAFEYKCKFWVWHGACKSHTSILKKYCKKSCGFCGASAPPKKAACASSLFGCCWDKKTKALGPNGLGCRPCKDKYKFCRRFYVDCVSGQNRDFLRENCPIACRICRPPKNWMEAKG